MRRSIKGLLIGILTVFMSLFWTVGCGGLDMPYIPSANTIDAVAQNTVSASLDGNVLTVQWGAVQLATQYSVTYNDKTQTVYAPSTSAVFTDVQYISGSITIVIIAQAVGYNNSAPTTYTFTPGEEPPDSQTLARPTGLVMSGDTLTWVAVQNATSYSVSDGTTTVLVTTNSINLATSGLNVPTSGSATYRVVAKATGYTDSAEATYTYTPGGQPPQPQTLATPTGLTVNNGKLTWAAVSNATSYTVSDGTTTKTVTTNSIDLAASGLKVPTSGSATYKVVAKAAGYTDSAEASFTYVYTPPQPTTLAVPVALFIASGILSWTAVENATSYVVSDGTTTKTVTTNSIDLAVNGFSMPDGGTKTYTVIAKAAGYNDSPAASKTYTFEHVHTYNMEQWETNETHHWHVATCGHSIIPEESRNYGTHNFGNGNVCSDCSYRRETPQLDKYVMYGEYPQTLMAANVTLGPSADSNGYYSGSDGARYAKVTATPYFMYTWSNVKFSNNENVNTGTDYFFKVEPIKWRVLSNKNGVAFLFCDSIIDNGAFYKNKDSRDIGGATVYPNNYAHSDIRAWLNGAFYNKAFSSAQQQNIQTTTVDNGVESTGYSQNPYVCENTQDKVFLLSNRDAINTSYGFIDQRADFDDARMLLVSDYARASGAYMSDSIAWFGRGQWWLRSPLWDNATCADYPTPSGTIFSGDMTNTHVGIAPAMRVATSALSVI